MRKSEKSPGKLNCDKKLSLNSDSSSQFRTITGICNNLANPYWGAANTLLSREIDDGEEILNGE